MVVPEAASGFGLGSLMPMTTMFYMLLLPALGLWYAYYVMSRSHLRELAAKIPGPPGYPIIGNALEFTGSSHQIFTRVYNYGKEYAHEHVVKLWIGPRLFVFLFDPRDIELILSSHVHIDKSVDYRFFEPWLGNGLLISSGQKWRSHRKLIAPTFHLNVLKSFIELFNDNSRQTVEKMAKLNGKTFDVHDYMSEATVEILLETAMGVSKKTQNKSGFEYALAVMKMCDILHHRQTKIWMRPNLVFNLTNMGKYQTQLLEIIHGLTQKVLMKKKEEYQKGTHRASLLTDRNEKLAEEYKQAEESKKETSNVRTTSVEGVSFGQSSGLKDDLDVDDNDVGEKKRMAFLDLLIESSQNGVVISDEEVREQVDTIMFEGHDTTAAGSSFFLSMMGVHQDIQDRVIQEMDDIFGDSDRPATFADTLEMKYLERVLLESLRMYPPVPLIAREIKKDVKLASRDLVLPAGTNVAIATIRLHHNESIYPNALKFNPDNFLPERMAERHYYSFIPFSAGPRSCVGRKYAMLKLKILLSTILRNFRVHSDMKADEFRLQADIILKREEGFQVRLEPRKTMVKA